VSAQVFTDAELLESEEHDLETAVLVLRSVLSSVLHEPRRTTARRTPRSFDLWSALCGVEIALNVVD